MFFFPMSGGRKLQLQLGLLGEQLNSACRVGDTHLLTGKKQSHTMDVMDVFSELTKEDYCGFYTMCNTLAKQFLQERSEQNNGRAVNLQDYRINFLLKGNGAGILRFEKTNENEVWEKTIFPQISTIALEERAVQLMSEVQAEHLESILNWSNNIRNFFWEDVYDTISSESEKRHSIKPFITDFVNHVHYIPNSEIVKVDYLCFHFRTTSFRIYPSDFFE